MDESVLRADCMRCAALCCVAPAFDRSESFAIDKPAGEACRHLGPDLRCTIHDDRMQRGFAGCVLYDCLGAGQRVVQEVFEGRSWKDDPAIAASMFEAFRIMRKVHELLLLLRTAERLPLSPSQRQACGRFLEALCPPLGWSPASLEEFDRSDRAQDVEAFLSTLRGYATALNAGAAPTS